MDTRESSPVVAAFSPRTGAREPVEFGLAAGRVMGAPLVIVAVADSGNVPVQFGADATAAAPSALRHLELDLERRGIFAEVRSYEDATAARGLARAIDELEPQLIVLGSTSRGAKGALLLGTTAERVIAVSACPIVVVPNGYEGPVARVGAAYCESPEGLQALRAAARLARLGELPLHVISAADPHEAAEREPQLRAQVAPYIEGLAAEVTITSGDASAVLVAASEEIDLLVMGSRGYGPRRAVILGSVSRRVIDRAACPVLVIPRGVEAVTSAPAPAVGTPAAHPHPAG